MTLNSNDIAKTKNKLTTLEYVCFMIIFDRSDLALRISRHFSSTQTTPFTTSFSKADRPRHTDKKRRLSRSASENRLSRSASGWSGINSTIFRTISVGSIRSPCSFLASRFLAGRFAYGFSTNVLAGRARFLLLALLPALLLGMVAVLTDRCCCCPGVAAAVVPARRRLLERIGMASVASMFGALLPLPLPLLLLLLLEEAGVDDDWDWLADVTGRLPFLLVLPMAQLVGIGLLRSYQSAAIVSVCCDRIGLLRGNSKI